MHKKRANRLGRSLRWLCALLVALLSTGLVAGCGGGGGGGSTPTTFVGGSGTGSGGSAVGSALCADCHGNTLNANGFVTGQTVDHDPSKTDLNQTSATHFETFAGASFSANWDAGVHGRPLIAASAVECETCHGNGSQHYGFGPIPRYAPGIATCTSCHSSGTSIPFAKAFTDAAFNQTAHANPNATPDGYFQQGGVGTSQGSFFGVAATDSNGLAVSKNQVIESCSGCHSPSQKETHIANNDVFNPPQVSCSACHDPHRPADASINHIATRNAAGSQDELVAANAQPVLGPQALNFKPQRVNMTTGAKDLNNGTWIRPRNAFPYHQGGDLTQTYIGYRRQGNVMGTAQGGAGCSITNGSPTVGVPTGAVAVITAGMEVQGTGIPAGATVLSVNTVGNTVTMSANATATNAAATLSFAEAGAPDVLRLSSAALCGSCHARGTYMANGTVATHNNDVYGQFLQSGHGDKDAAAFRYYFSQQAAGISNRPVYPQDMGGKPGQNGTTVPFDVRPVRKDPWDVTTGSKGRDNGTCWQCHHGVGTIAFQKGTVFGNAIGDTQNADILWGDSALTCISCHEPHQNGSGVATTTKNVRVPKYTSYNTEFRTDKLAGIVGAGGNLRGGVTGVFHDLAPLPSGIGNSVMCLVCHQGRDSSWTIWNKTRRSRVKAGDLEPAAEQFFFNPANANTAIGPNPDGAGNFGLSQEHYLLGASLLYGRNLFEYVGKSYSSGLPKHLQQNCTGCHMGPKTLADKGGHTWKPSNTTCNTSGCHDGSSPLQTSVNSDFHNVPARANYSGLNGLDGSTYQEVGHPEVIAANLPIATAADRIALYKNQAIGGTGLLGQLNRALYASGVRYTASGGSPFSTPTGGTITWTPRKLMATVNFYGAYNGDNSGFTHNVYYTAQVVIDSINDLQGVNNDLDGAVPLFSVSSDGNPFNRPAGAYTNGNAHTGEPLYNRVPTPAITQ